MKKALQRYYMQQQQDKIEMMLYLLENGANPFFYLIELDLATVDISVMWSNFCYHGTPLYCLAYTLSTNYYTDYDREINKKAINILNRCFDKETGKNFFASCPANELRIIFESVNIDDDTKKEIIYYGGNALKKLLKDQIGSFQCMTI